MIKKILVKQIIDKLLDQGKDFADLTQVALGRIKELEGISRTTIKRAKQEYKQEKIVIQSNYKEQSIKRKIYKYLDRHPKSALDDLREEFPKINPPKVSEYHLFWKRKQEKKSQDQRTKLIALSPRKLKELVFKYLDENPHNKIAQLYDAFSDANNHSLENYYENWKKKQQVSDETAREGSLLHALFKHLDKNSEDKVDDLQKAFPDAHRRSLEIYYSHWQKKREIEENELIIVEKIAEEVSELSALAGKQFEKPNVTSKVLKLPVAKIVTTSDTAVKLIKTKKEKKPASQREEDFSQLDNNTDLALSKRREIPRKKLKEKRTIIEKSKKQPKRLEPAVPRVEPQKISYADSVKELVASLQNTIDQQKKYISKLNNEYSKLIEQQSNIAKELQGLEQIEQNEVKDFLSIYLSGLRRD